MCISHTCINSELGSALLGSWAGFPYNIMGLLIPEGPMVFKDMLFLKAGATGGQPKQEKKKTHENTVMHCDV